MANWWVRAALAVTWCAALIIAACAPAVRSASPADGAASQAQATALPGLTSRAVPILPPTRTPTPTGTPGFPGMTYSGFATVDIGDSYFYPNVLTVTVGTRVRWTHVGSALHDVSSTDRSWGVGRMLHGNAFEVTFTHTGEFPYVCFLHLPGMTGQVIVVNR